MLDRDTVMDTVNKAYAARRLGDKEALRRYFAPDAVFRMVGRSSLLGGLAVGPADAATAVDHLIDLFRFHEMTQERVIVDGQTVMIHWKVMTSTGGGDCVDTELCDILTVDDDGKVARVDEFADTALLAHMLASGPAKSPSVAQD